ncbi:MAG: molecular chaperone TorD family protein [Lautropia sp.]|nr:molecular chaperone TorD family protein [Lautropia sp.]
MRGATSPAELVERLEAEDLARARWYSFFSRWFLAPPDQQAIDLFVGSSSGNPTAADRVPAAEDSQLEAAWKTFAGMLARQPLASIRTAYDDTFISVGEAPVSLHASVYLTGFSNERPLAEVRQWLAARGIQSGQAGLLTEDHLGLLCEAMAWLIIGHEDDNEAPSAESVAASDQSQQYLFQRFIAPVCDEFCQRLADAPDAGVYRGLGQLFSAFCSVERQAFDIDR